MSVISKRFDNHLSGEGDSVKIKAMNQRQSCSLFMFES